MIGGSGLYAIDGLEVVDERRIDTPFGQPSDAVIIGKLDGQNIAFLPRHGRDHNLAPHEINYRANIWAMKSVGVRWLLSVSAVGSLREDIAPGDLVLVDQFIDRTRTRPSTFFEGGVVAHVTFADPCCRELRAALAATCQERGLNVHGTGTYVCIEGPQFSTRAESHLYRQWGAAVVGMTNLPEARLAREAQMAYATLAMATDYDCWRPSDDVDVSEIIAVLRANVDKAKGVVAHLGPHLEARGESEAWTALKHAIMTHAIPDDIRERFALLIDGA